MNKQKMDKQKTLEGKARSEGTWPVLSRIYFIDRQIASGKYPSNSWLLVRHREYYADASKAYPAKNFRHYKVIYEECELKGS